MVQIDLVGFVCIRILLRITGSIGHELVPVVPRSCNKSSFFALEKTRASGRNVGKVPTLFFKAGMGEVHLSHDQPVEKPSLRMCNRQLHYVFHCNTIEIVHEERGYDGREDRRENEI